MLAHRITTRLMEFAFAWVGAFCAFIYSGLNAHDSSRFQLESISIFIMSLFVALSLTALRQVIVVLAEDNWRFTILRMVVFLSVVADRRKVRGQDCVHWCLLPTPNSESRSHQTSKVSLAATAIRPFSHRQTLCILPDSSSLGSMTSECASAERPAVLSVPVALIVGSIVWFQLRQNH
jgi:hypothetical protein